jgi:hypothetical protein
LKYERRVISERQLEAISRRKVTVASTVFSLRRTAIGSSHQAPTNLHIPDVSAHV